MQLIDLQNFYSVGRRRNSEGTHTFTLKFYLSNSSYWNVIAIMIRPRSFVAASKHSVYSMRMCVCLLLIVCKYYPRAYADDILVAAISTKVFF